MDEPFPARPAVDVWGVVDASGAAGGSSGGTIWDLVYHFAAWRLADQRVQRRPRMRLLQDTPKAELSGLMKEVRPFSVWHVRAVVAQIHSAQDWVLARVTERIGIDSADLELAAVAQELQRAVIVADAQFGPLTLDRRSNTFTGATDWNGQRVRLRVPADGEAAVPSEKSLAAARMLWADSANWRRRVNAFAVERLLPIKNDVWLEDGESPLSAVEFLARMRLEDIEQGDGDESPFTFWHDDGDLFWGHTIQITGNLRDGPTHADIPG